MAGADARDVAGAGALRTDVTAGAQELLAAARAAEPGLRLAERTEALDELERVLAEHRDHPLQADLLAERAVDAARLMHLERATALADEVDAAVPCSPTARARATEARGRALAFSGTDAALHRAERVLLDAVAQYAALPDVEWQGYALFTIGYAVHVLNGSLVEGCRYLDQALGVLPPTSPRRPSVLTFYADAVIALGDWPAAERTLTEAEQLARAADDRTSGSYLTWSRARIASARGDAMATQQHLRETEREATDWFDTLTGTTFLAEAAELLDRVGRGDEARRYLDRARQRDAADPFVRQAEAMLEARTGDATRGIALLEALAGEQLLEKATRWRHTLLLAWATLRAGGDAGLLAARALAQAAAAGGVRVALAHEPAIIAALLAPAEAADATGSDEAVGSAEARRLLAGDGLIVRLLGPPRITRADGSDVPLPGGRAAELVRLLALHPRGVGVEVVLDRFFPGVEPAAARHRLRQLLTSLRASSGELVVREGERLCLASAWVDLRAFDEAAGRARGRDARSELARHHALAVWTGDPLPTDTYSEWVDPLLDQLRARHDDLQNAAEKFGPQVSRIGPARS